MAAFKCKMCGGDLIIEKGSTVAECEYCGSKQTLPKLDDDRRTIFYNRANHFRRNNEFDKAAGIYERILNEDTTDAEAYWSLVLCRYGIEYVEDPATRKRVPTVNRAQFTSVFDDDNYKSALQYADGYQRSIYEAEAHAINEIQKGILAISQKEEPFDVFICYKETDANGRRTQDSVLANDLYHQLTQEGFKVFFSRITLEDKLGTAYEPYIFAALNSAKVMVVLGTKPEYFNAVWVKNEWSRYLALVKQSGGKKVLIPAYRDMDPYDLPAEFSHLQAQDMSKLGFMQDLIRGIKKITSESNTQQRATERNEAPDVNQIANNIEPLIKRIEIFINGEEWEKAYEYCEKVLDMDPENADAYFFGVIAGDKANKKTIAYGKQLEMLSGKLTDHAWEIETLDNCNDHICIFGRAKAYGICEKIMDRYPEFHKTIMYDTDNKYSSILSYVAVICFDIKLLELLLSHGADPNSIRTHKSGTIIPIADDAIWNCRSIKLLELLLRYGADPNGIRYFHDNKAVGEYSLLSDAIWNAKSFDIAKLLLENGANANRVEHFTNYEGNVFSKSMLTNAVVDMNSADMVRLLFKYGATLEHEITLDGVTKVERKFPYHKKNIPEDVLEALRENGWKGDRWF